LITISISSTFLAVPGGTWFVNYNRYLRATVIALPIRITLANTIIAQTISSAFLAISNWAAWYRSFFATIYSSPSAVATALAIIAPTISSAFLVGVSRRAAIRMG